MKKKSSLVICILLLAFGAYCIYAGIGMVKSNSINWPSLQGKVASSYIDSSTSNDEDEYYVDVTYEYTISGSKYSSSFKTTSQTTKSDAEQDMLSYRPGSEITIYYDPNDPSSSTTSPGAMELWGVVGLLAGIFFVGAGGWGIRAYFIPEKSPGAGALKPAGTPGK